MADSSQKKDYSNPVYKEISLKNGEINKWNKLQLVAKLEELELDKEGTTDVLKKRLKSHMRKQKLIKAGLESDDIINPVKCPFDYLVVIDYEATCEKENPTDYVHEIIEFPVVLINSKTLKMEKEFRTFCRPVLHPKLSDFCTELTGITQAQVDGAPLFSDVLDQFENWLEENKLGSEYSFAIVTDGPWDIICFLNVQCVLSQISFPEYARRWINIRKLFSNYYHTRRLKLTLMLDHLGMTFEGRQHSGIADCRNIARIMVKLLEDGCQIKTNEVFTLPKQTYGDSDGMSEIDSQDDVEQVDDITEKIQSITVEKKAEHVSHVDKSAGNRTLSEKSARRKTTHSQQPKDSKQAAQLSQAKNINDSNDSIRNKEQKASVKDHVMEKASDVGDGPWQIVTKNKNKKK
uniref:3'-5' exoribonuclease 1-like n=1 Tax=Saccoglossus kowalevskii TaxID=10224 RepID=A0ABM0ML09_SACKO|nr:PREDICTED: 3'-5' exoribonuclease 1-like [Saccoglossus kowalevskii]